MASYSNRPGSATGIDGYFRMEDPPTAAVDEISCLVGNVGANFYRCFEVFDISEIPQGSTCTDFTLTLRQLGGVASAPAATLRKIEGDSNDIVENQINHVTRSTASGPWDTEGGDFDGAAVALNFLTSVGNLEIDVNALVQAAVDAGHAKIGFILHRDDEVTSDSIFATFGMSEHGTSTNRPLLAGTYEPAADPGGAGAIPPFLLED